MYLKPTLQLHNLELLGILSGSLKTDTHTNTETVAIRPPEEYQFSLEFLYNYEDDTYSYNESDGWTLEWK